MRWLCCLLIGCGSGVGTSPDAPVVHDTTPGVDASHDAAVVADGATVDADPGLDGMPTRQPCTSKFGNALPSSGTFGRLDGFLVSIVPPGSGNNCNADDSHVHLQIEMNQAIYDIAIDVTDGSTGMDDVHTTTRELALPAWSEGFHTGETFDYVAQGVHAADLPLLDKAQMTAAIDGDLTTANHVSIFATTYGGGGAHLVHRNGSGHDGALVTQPLSSPAHARLFSFSDQTF